jgi:hypothetical protein
MDRSIEQNLYKLDFPVKHVEEAIRLLKLSRQPQIAIWPGVHLQ